MAEASDHGTPDRPLTLLVVCSANRCRSPIGEVIARDRASTRGLSLDVSSAGTSTRTGLPATDGAIMTAKQMGLDLRNHTSRQVDHEIVGHADLIVTMEPRHVIELVGTHGAALLRTFTLPELAELVGAAAPRQSDEGLNAWLDRIGRGRQPIDVLSAAEIDDPIGRSMRHYRSMAKLVATCIDRLLDGVTGSATAPPEEGDPVRTGRASVRWKRE